MKIKAERISYLWLKFLQGELTAAENKELETVLSESKAIQEGHSLLRDNDFTADQLKNLSYIINRKDIVERRIREKMFRPDVKPIANRTKLSFMWIRTAAAVGFGVILLLTGIWIFSGKEKSKPIVVEEKTQPQLAPEPGGNKAILVLADGSNVVLDSTVKGNLKMANASAIVNTSQGIISYTEQTRSTNAATEFNTLKTPIGGQYRLKLSDGSIVWLNAQSSIQYPTTFNGATREVSITGEVYLEIAKNASQPFIVSLPDQSRIDVLGTKFAVNCYDNEPFSRTTLVEGSIQLVNNKGPNSTFKIKLSPGQQAQIKSGEEPVIKEAGTDEATAFVHGYFHFTGDDIQAVCRQLARWYNVEVIYEGKPQNKLLKGDIERSLPLTDVIGILQGMGANMELKGNRLYIRS